MSRYQLLKSQYNKLICTDSSNQMKSRKYPDNPDLNLQARFFALNLKPFENHIYPLKKNVDNFES